MFNFFRKIKMKMELAKVMREELGGFDPLFLEALNVYKKRKIDYYNRRLNSLLNEQKKAISFGIFFNKKDTIDIEELKYLKSKIKEIPFITGIDFHVRSDIKEIIRKEFFLLDEERNILLPNEVIEKEYIYIGEITEYIIKDHVFMYQGVFYYANVYRSSYYKNLNEVIKYHLGELEQVTDLPPYKKELVIKLLREKAPHLLP